MSTQQLSFLLSDLTASTTTFSDISDLMNWLNNVCSPILRHVKIQISPSYKFFPLDQWSYPPPKRKSECKWKKTPLHVNYLLMMQLLVTLNQLILGHVHGGISENGDFQFLLNFFKSCPHVQFWKNISIHV